MDADGSRVDDKRLAEIIAHEIQHHIQFYESFTYQDYAGQPYKTRPGEIESEYAGILQAVPEYRKNPLLDDTIDVYDIHRNTESTARGGGTADQTRSEGSGRIGDGQLFSDMRNGNGQNNDTSGSGESVDSEGRTTLSGLSTNQYSVGERTDRRISDTDNVNMYVEE